MKKNISDEKIKYIIGRILEYAVDAVEESEKNKKDPFYLGRRLAFYEVLDVIRNELDVDDIDLKEFGLDFDLERKLL